MARLATWSLLILVFVLGACDPLIREGWFACVDHAGCPEGWFCHADRLCYSVEAPRENTAQTCANGLDDDGKGGADCFDAACIEGGFCQAQEPDPPCDPLAQTGCPTGMACYQIFRADQTFGAVCRLPGTGVPGEACATAELDPADAHVCSGGAGCYHLQGQTGTCGVYCELDAECPDGALCEGEDEAGRPGLCPTPCNPNQAIPCPTPLACASYSVLGGLTYLDGGARHLCVTAASVRAGTADAGQACVDPPLGSTPDDQVCRLGSVCVPDGGAAVCRKICQLAASSPCPEGDVCHRPQEATYSARPLFSAYGEELGYCM